MIIYIAYKIEYSQVHWHKFITDIYVNKFPPKCEHRHRFYIDDNSEYFYIVNYPFIYATDVEPDSGYFTKFKTINKRGKLCEKEIK